MDDIWFYLSMNGGNVNRLIWDVLNHPYRRINLEKVQFSIDNKNYYKINFKQEPNDILTMDPMTLLDKLEEIGLLR